MCSSSVEPMPSMMRSPLASNHSWLVAAGSASPADTHLRRLGAGQGWPCSDSAIARHEVGAVNITVAPKRCTPAISSGPDTRSISAVDAPTLSGNSSSPPRPKVKASGGLPMKMSSAVGRSTWGGQQAQAAITSRWKCIVAFGRPVVPEVKAIRQMSSAAVSRLSKAADCKAIAASSDNAGSATSPLPLLPSLPSASLK